MRKPALKISFLCAIIFSAAIGLAQKTDKLFLKNGDVITGEMKSMKFAKLRFDMTGPGIIEIKWEEIVRLKSEKTFQVTLRGGDLLVVNLDSLFFEMNHVSMNDIVEIVWLNDRFIQRINGNVSLGFNYTKSSEIFQFNFASAVTYRKPKTETSFKINSVITDNANDSNTTKKQDATLEYIRNLKKSNYMQSALGWQQNTQLGLQNRLSLAGVVGNKIVNNNQQRLLVGSGLSFNVEQSSKSNEYKENLEALAIVQFKKFRYTTPKISIDAQYIIFPSISDWGRYRMTFDLNTKYEIFKDFNVGLTFYDNFDNRPPSGAVTKNDLGINFTVGYEFGKL